MRRRKIFQKRKRWWNKELMRHGGLNSIELVEPHLGLALQHMELISSCEEISLLALAELLGLLDLGLVMIPILGKGLDLGFVFLGQVGKLGSQLGGSVLLLLQLGSMLFLKFFLLSWRG